MGGGGRARFSKLLDLDGADAKDDLRVYMLSTQLFHHPTLPWFSRFVLLSDNTTSR